MIRSFDENPFKGQSASDSNWLPIRDSALPQNSPRPGSCSIDSKSLSERSLNFIKGHSLMDQAVNNKYAQPLLVRTSLKVKKSTTSCAVSPKEFLGFLTFPTSLSAGTFDCDRRGPTGPLSIRRRLRRYLHRNHKGQSSQVHLGHRLERHPRKKPAQTHPH